MVPIPGNRSQSPSSILGSRMFPGGSEDGGLHQLPTESLPVASSPQRKWGRHEAI